MAALAYSASVASRGTFTVRARASRAQLNKRINIVCMATPDNNRGSVSLGQKVVAAAAAAAMFLAPAGPAFAADKAALQAKGRVFAEASADVLRAAPAGDLRGAIGAAVEVALSANPQKALAAVDAALEALETASTADLLAVVKAAEHATTASMDAGLLIPPNEEIDKVVDAAAAAAGGVSPAALSKFSKLATEAALSADGKKIGGLTFAGGRLGLSVGPGKITAATAAAVDLLTAL
eukprot:CAMPEP_0197583732 /NCGR_PEP_ID=MMETSP1326-20131121/6556_1 /TAXON_ID=1155430 /ORGANISM="Genus nov. species nov., Strain RCC2288" /LENGTH=236 /DNA_ID=CAMNT_0043147991 /DNA_START=97 /DNA_END=807 /DNA_ORIENTATION=+